VNQQPQSWIGLAVTMAIVGIVTLIRLRNVGRQRRLRIETLWVIPAIYGAIVAYVFWHFPPHGSVWLYCAIALWGGVALGWNRGRLMRITVDPETHALNQATSPAALLFILVIVVLRIGSHSVAEYISPGQFGVMAATDILMALAIGFIAAQRLEMFLRAKTLLAEARAARR
jgi:hypothetical protein